MKGTVLVTVVFPSIFNYLPDLAESVHAQTYKDFDWLIVNDGCAIDDIHKITKDLRVAVLQAKSSLPIINRFDAMAWCKNENYRNIVFQDGDDWMSVKRMECVVALLSDYNVVISDLSIADSERNIIRENIWSVRFKNTRIFDQEFLNDKNCVGFGNTAINSGLVSADKNIDTSVLAADWYLFYQLMENEKAVYCPEPVYYRQHEENFVGKKQLSVTSIEQCIKVKRAHYDALKDQYPGLEKQEQKLEVFIKEIFNKADILTNFINNNQSKYLNSFWWEETNYNYDGTVND